jgi:predicted ArsR family transcriptional regulator
MRRREKRTMTKGKSKSRFPTTGRIGRIAKKIEAEAGLEVLQDVMRDVDEFQRARSGADKAAWVKRLIARLEERVGREKTISIMQKCGLMCCGVTSRKRVKQLMSESGSVEELVEKLNKTGLGGGRLKMKDENTIAGGYDRCYCGLVKHTKEPFPTDTYCWCSTGWYKQLFETALGRHVDVELIQSIVSGADTCEFVIHI